MRLGERLKQVVVANFIEIARDEEGNAGQATKKGVPASAHGVAYNDSSEQAAATQAVGTISSGVNGVGDRSVTPVTPVTPVTAALSMTTPTLPSPSPEVIPAADLTTESHRIPDITQWFEGADPAMASEYAGILASDGTPDFERLFQNADLAAVSCSADEAIKILADMPADLPMRVRRITARATVDRLSQSNPTALNDIISDASQKMVRVARLAERTGERAGVFQTAITTEIDALEAQIAERRASLATLEERQQSVQKACRARMAELNNVVLFFDHPDVSGAAGASSPMPATISSGMEPAGSSPEDSEEIPPFLRDDAVRRMLGIRENGVGLPSSEDDAESAASPTRRAGAGRRRVAASAGSADE